MVDVSVVAVMVVVVRVVLMGVMHRMSVSVTVGMGMRVTCERKSHAQLVSDTLEIFKRLSCHTVMSMMSVMNV